MNKLNLNIPSFKALTRKSHFTKNEKDTETFLNVYCFGIQSVAGVILTFHVMTDDGMVRSRVPISEIYLKEPTNDIPFNHKQLDHLYYNELLTILRMNLLYNFYTHITHQIPHPIIY